MQRRCRNLFQPHRSTKFKSTLLTSLTGLAGLANAGIFPVSIVQMPPVPQGVFSIWLEERNLPPLHKDIITKATSSVPMFRAEFARAVATRH